MNPILAIIVALGVSSLAVYGVALAAKYVDRCSQCRRPFVAGTPIHWCLGGHKLHDTCVKREMGREICPICGIYVSALPHSADAI